MSVRLAFAVPDIKIVRVLPHRPLNDLAGLADGVTTPSTANIWLFAPGRVPFSIAIIRCVDFIAARAIFEGFTTGGACPGLRARRPAKTRKFHSGNQPRHRWDAGRHSLPGGGRGRCAKQDMASPRRILGRGGVWYANR